MHPYRDSKLSQFLIGIFFVLIFAYAYYEARGLIYGPQIQVANSVAEVHTPYVVISGTTTHIASLSANGQEVPVTKEGAFADPYLLAVGDNRITLEAKDKYGRTTTKLVEIVYIAPATSTPDTATSTTKVATSTKTTTSTSTPIAPTH